MTRQDFHTLTKNINVYRVVKPLVGKLHHSKIGDKYNSETLYENDYNITDLLDRGFIELVPVTFPFESEIVNTNEHTVFSLCPDCHHWGVNFPLDKVCGNCGYPKTITYYDAETIDKYIKSLYLK